MRVTNTILGRMQLHLSQLVMGQIFGQNQLKQTQGMITEDDSFQKIPAGS
jgi:hypothetical protein